MIEQLRTVLEKLGYHSEPVHFDRAVPYSKLRERLSGPFAKTEVSQVLRHLPDLFVMNHKMVHGIFFIKVMDDLDSLTDEARATYKKFYPRDILLLKTSKSGKATRIECRWIDEKGRSKSLIECLTSRFKYVPPKAAIEELSNGGWRL